MSGGHRLKLYLAVRWSANVPTGYCTVYVDKNTRTGQHDYLAKEGDGDNVDVLWSENFHREKDVSINM